MANNTRLIHLPLQKKKKVMTNVFISLFGKEILHNLINISNTYAVGSRMQLGNT